MILKTLIRAFVVGLIFLSETAYAYDLPKISVDKKEVAETSKEESSKSKNWQSAKLFEQKLKLLLDENKNIPASSKERINRDKNLIFVAFYKGNAYFLDRYSVKVVKNNSKRQSWRQHIFPIGQNISPKDSKYTMQKFCLQGAEFYNSLKDGNKISKLENVEDKEFLAECFKVGYYYAFKKEIDVR